MIRLESNNNKFLLEIREVNKSIMPWYIKWKPQKMHRVIDFGALNHWFYLVINK